MLERNSRTLLTSRKKDWKRKTFKCQTSWHRISMTKGKGQNIRRILSFSVNQKGILDRKRRKRNAHDMNCRVVDISRSCLQHILSSSSWICFGLNNTPCNRNHDFFYGCCQSRSSLFSWLIIFHPSIDVFWPRGQSSLVQSLSVCSTCVTTRVFSDSEFVMDGEWWWVEKWKRLH